MGLTTQITVRLPTDTVIAMDAAAEVQRRPRADIVRIAVNRYLEDYTDIGIAIDALRNPEDETIDWDTAREQLQRLDT